MVWCREKKNKLAYSTTVAKRIEMNPHHDKKKQQNEGDFQSKCDLSQFTWNVSVYTLNKAINLIEWIERYIPFIKRI